MSSAFHICHPFGNRRATTLRCTVLSTSEVLYDKVPFEIGTWTFMLELRSTDQLEDILDF